MSEPQPGPGIRERRPRPPFPEQPLEPPGIEADMRPRPEYLAPEYRGAGKLEGKVAIITGGDSGIGRAVAVLFAREGADCALLFLEEERPDAEEAREAVEREGRRALLVAGDVRDPGFCKNAVQHVLDRFGRVDVLVNNAAFQKHRAGIEEISLEQWDRTFKTNIYGYFHMARAVLPHMGAGSCIVNTGSITGLEGSRELIDYAATKGAIHAFTKSLAQSLVDRSIRVNCVAPGPVWTPLNPAEREGDAKQLGADTPLGRPAQPEEIAPAYVYFASNVDSSYVTGEVLTLLGGATTAA
ncbi:MAG TPA: SDR family oxidoreductase [Longimicrobiales bacterium]|nr:SDR family oxidoreductase [Longimicrobiales bacterium]